MFPNGDMSGLLAQAQAIQEQMQRAQQELQELEVVGSASGGLVEATMAGTGELKRLMIKPEVCDPDDTETLADLIVAAVHDATAKINAHSQAKLGAMTGGLDLGGMDLNGLGLPGMGR